MRYLSLNLQKIKISKGEEYSGISKKDVDERERLQTLVQLQAQEIGALKAEISILSRKGGKLISICLAFVGDLIGNLCILFSRPYFTASTTTKHEPIATSLKTVFIFGL
jgi:hypothetical protein